MLKSTPLKATSGNARPDRLNSPSLVSPMLERYPETAVDWYEGMAKMFENPPEENDAATSAPTPWVAPTEVTLPNLFVRIAGVFKRYATYKGHVDGNVGKKVSQPVDCEPPTPPSPDENKTVTPRAPSCA